MPTLLNAFFVFVYGLAIGSFLNVIAYRVPIGESIISLPSYCPKCEKRIQKRDLIPILSYIILGGKCRYCKAGIGIRTPIVEFLTALLSVIAYFIYGFSVAFVFYAVLTFVLIIISLIDIDYTIIPDRLILFAFFLGGVYHYYGFYSQGANYTPYAISALIGLFAASVILYIISLLSGGGIGGGDIKLMAAFGFCIGWEKILLALILAAILGSVVGIALMLAKKAGLKTALPFGPYLAAGIFISALFGNVIIETYLRFVHSFLLW